MKRLAFHRYDYAAFLTFCMYAMCSLVVPLCLVPMSKDLSFPLNAGGMGYGGIIQLGRSIPMTFTLVFCGFFAGRWGNRISLGIAMLFVGVGIFCVGITPTYWMLLLAVGVAGLGEGIIEGLGTPFVYDQHPEDSARYVNFAHSFWSVGVFLAVLVCSFFLSANIVWREIVVLFGILALVPAGMLLFKNPKTINYREDKSINLSVIWKNSKLLFSKTRFWLFLLSMFFAGGGEFCITFWTPSFIQIVHGNSIWGASFGIALFALGMLTSRMLSGCLVPNHRMKELILSCAFGDAVIAFFIPLIDSIGVLFFCLFIVGIMTGPLWASIQSCCVQRLHEDSTTIFIMLSASGIPGCGVFSALTGALGDLWGLRWAFYTAPVSFLLIIFLIGIEGIINKVDGRNVSS